jgi:hypothetical protein
MKRDTALMWLCLAVYLLSMFGVGAALGRLTAPAPPPPAAPTQAPVAGVEP